MIEGRVAEEVHECGSQTRARIFIYFWDEDRTVTPLSERPVKMEQVFERLTSLSF